MYERRGLFSWLSRHSTALFLFFTVFTFLQLGFYASSWSTTPITPTTSSSSSSDGGVIKTHPIPKLMDEAEERYKKKLASQSRTLKDAVEEYRKRYKRPPPKGFDTWFSKAMENNVVMTDEYDGMMEDLEPFYELSGLEVRRRSVQVGSLPSIDIVRIRDGIAKTVNLNKGFEDSEVGARAEGFKSMIEKVAHLLPDMDFPINAKAESRVIVPWEHRRHPNLTIQDSSMGIEKMLGGPFIPDWKDDGNVWDSWRRTCPPNSTARRLFESIRTPFARDSINYLQQETDNTFTPSNSDSTTTTSTTSTTPSTPFSFTPGTTGSDFHFSSQTSYTTLDFCSSPHSHYSQGHFFSDWRTIPALYPIFSPAKARGFMDIKIPSHYYYGSTSRYTYGWDPVNLELKERDPMEVPWEEKKDQVFWRGATTGGGNHPTGFMDFYQRHRFLRMASKGSKGEDTETRVVVFPDPELLPTTSINSSSTLPPPPNRYLSVTLPLSHLNSQIMNVAFTKITASVSLTSKDFTDRYRVANPVPLGTHWQYKYLVDLDGMSYSGRFMAFLESESVPIKATVYEEFWGGWVEPWVHFIPLSTTYREIYNIFAFFSGPPDAAMELLKPLTNSSSESELDSSSSSEPESGSTLASNSDSGSDINTKISTPKNTRKVYNPTGDARLRRIARAGKQWKKTVGRGVDIEMYVYRLALEWARLWADDREEMSFRM